MVMQKGSVCVKRYIKAKYYYYIIIIVSTNLRSRLIRKELQQTDQNLT